jgi:hypothetical protein
MKDTSSIGSNTKQQFGLPKSYSKRKFVGSFKVDPELWSRFKRSCAEKGVSACYVLETLLEGWIQAEKVMATIIQPVNMTINMQHIVKRPRRMIEVPGPEYTTPAGCQGLRHEEIWPGRLGWCRIIKKWIQPQNCEECRELHRK